MSIVLCKNCKYFRKAHHPDWNHYAKCSHTVKNYDYVNGEKHEYFFCSTQRESVVVDRCGPEGQFYEEKA